MEIVELLGALLSLLYLYFEYHAKSAIWPVWLLSTLLYAGIYLYAGFYAGSIIQVYYVFTAIQGWYLWRKNKDGVEPPIRLIGRKTALFSVLCSGVVLALLMILLYRFSDSKLWYADAFTTSLSIVGLWLLAQKYYHHWIYWIIVNLSTSVMYFYAEMPISGVLFGVYFVVSIMGFFNWRKLYQKIPSKALPL